MSLDRKQFTPSSPPRYDTLGYPIDRYGRTAVLSEEPIDIDNGRPIGPSLPRCHNFDCHGCLLWGWDDPDTGYPCGRVCGFCGSTERFSISDPGDFITVAEASSAKSRYKLRLGGAETAAEEAVAKEVLRKVGEALVNSISEGRRSLERSYFKQYLLSYARWENEGFCWTYTPSMSSAERVKYDERRCRVNKAMLDTNWSVVIKEIVDKIGEIKMKRKILEEIRFLGI